MHIPEEARCSRDERREILGELLNISLVFSESFGYLLDSRLTAEGIIEQCYTVRLYIERSQQPSKFSFWGESF